ncbi:uncharacterized protein [Macrobrachium rosenbergii]|uniref:uncharacterized protein n=1 Tax=Macrobrachium rosenbergii TaxID=79674 RepID=UPI0034D7A291
MKALVLLLSLISVCWCKPTTVVNFSPVGNTPGVAPGFAYAFRAPAPLYKSNPVITGVHPPIQDPPSNGISAPEEETPTVLKTQYHSQDLLGQYAFGYVGDATIAHEVRTRDGAVRGSYTYLDANGELQTANYIADDNGFRVEATNLPSAPTAPAMPKMLLPEPVKPTPEVEAATAAHLKAVAEIKAARHTLEVEEAAAAHLKAVAEIKAARSRRSQTSGAAVNKVHSSSVPLEMSYVPFAAPSLNIIKPHPTLIKALPSPYSEAVPSQDPSQFHSHKESGGFKYGYGGGHSLEHEVELPDGVTRGSYTYIDTNGKVRRVSYIADDEFGFRGFPKTPYDPWAPKTYVA